MGRPVSQLLRRRGIEFKKRNSTPFPIVDAKDRVVAVCAGQPNDPEYGKCCDQFSKLLAAEGKGAALGEVKNSHKRGAFPAINVGIYHGQGTKKPVNLNCKQHSAFVQDLLKSENVQRVAGYADGVCVGYRIRASSNTSGY
jgi:hypothetical protein